MTPEQRDWIVDRHLAIVKRHRAAIASIRYAIRTGRAKGGAALSEHDVTECKEALIAEVFLRDAHIAAATAIADAKVYP